MRAYNEQHLVVNVRDTLTNVYITPLKSHAPLQVQSQGFTDKGLLQKLLPFSLQGHASLSYLSSPSAAHFFAGHREKEKLTTIDVFTTTSSKYCVTISRDILRVWSCEAKRVVAALKVDLPSWETSVVPALGMCCGISLSVLS